MHGVGSHDNLLGGPRDGIGCHTNMLGGHIHINMFVGHNCV